MKKINIKSSGSCLSLASITENALVNCLRQLEPEKDFRGTDVKNRHRRYH
jgi:hypothetical protein